MENKTKIKIATLLLASGLAVAAGVHYNKNLYNNQFKKEISNMTETQLRDVIKECDTALEHLQKTIDADETNAEERFEARRAYKDITKKREQLQQRLDKLEDKTIPIRSAVQSR